MNLAGALIIGWALRHLFWWSKPEFSFLLSKLSRCIQHCWYVIGAQFNRITPGVPHWPHQKPPFYWSFPKGRVCISSAYLYLRLRICCWDPNSYLPGFILLSDTRFSKSSLGTKIFLQSEVNIPTQGFLITVFQIA